MGNIKVILPDGKPLELQDGNTILDAAKKIGERLAKATIAGEVNGEIADLREVLKDGDKLRIITDRDPEALSVLRHSTAHVMAEAVQRIFPGTLVTIGPNIDDGFYYDFDREQGFKPEDLEKIEAEMQKIIKEDRPFTREILSRDEARALFAKLGEKYKVEIIDELPPDSRITVYRQKDWFDLCRGPHIQSTGQIKAFKLLSVAGAYWRGDEKNQMLARIYGTAFFSKKELDEYIYALEEAKKRDHRRLGKEQDLFSVIDEIGSGLILWHPKAGRTRSLIEDFWRKAHFEHGYEIVFTPNIGKADLWRTSGHLGFYKDTMYSPMDIEGQPYFIKPMNCPFHIHIYNAKVRSYRDLPMRFAELGNVYRFERSGVLHGLLRVRGFTMDDAHIFCRPDQIEQEIIRVVEFSHAILKAFGFTDFQAYLATRPKDAVGEPERWEQATQALARAAEKLNLNLKLDEGGGAFYGPKIDIKLKDSLKREWQCTTVQFDFNLPERFNITYVGEDNKPHRPYMVHRALLGSLERFFGVLVEHYAANFPAWLAYEQVRLAPITERNNETARKLKKTLKSLGIRASVDDTNNKLNYKIRNAEVDKVPWIFVIGDKDEEKGGVSVRRHGEGDKGFMKTEEAIELIKADCQMPELNLPEYDD